MLLFSGSFYSRHHGCVKILPKVRKIPQEIFTRRDLLFMLLSIQCKREKRWQKGATL